MIRAKQDGFDFSVREAINRMQSQGVYVSQKVLYFALKQVNEI
jgi:predicted nucleic acid-binding protein